MTVIAVKGDTIAADSRYTIETEAGGVRMGTCTKLYRKRTTFQGVEQDVIIGIAGEGFPGLVFVDWFGTGKEPPDNLIHGDADFTAVVLTADGVWEFDKWCRGEKNLDPYMAAGCGAKAALCAMAMGASPTRACELTLGIDPFCGPPITTMRLKSGKQQKAKRPSVPKLRKGNDQRAEDGSGQTPVVVPGIDG